MATRGLLERAWKEKAFRERKIIEELTEKYLKEIKKIRAHGPYYLGGWSLGGLIAYEMAKQLHDQNEQVFNVYLIDSNFRTLEERRMATKNSKPDLSAFLERRPVYKFLPKKYLDRVYAALEIEGYMIDNYNTPSVYNGNVTLFHATQPEDFSDNVENENQNIISRADIDTLIKEKIEKWQNVAKHLREISFNATHGSIIEGEHLRRMTKFIMDDILNSTNQTKI